MLLAGGAVVWLFFAWESRLIARGGEPLVDPEILRVPVLRGGLTSFFFQYFLQGGLFFAVPLFLSIALGLSAIDTGVRLLPLSFTLILAAAGVPKIFPDASPRRVVRIGFGLLFAGARGDGRRARRRRRGRDHDLADVPRRPRRSGPSPRSLGASPSPRCPTSRAGEVGGLQNTITNLGILGRHGADRRDRDRRPQLLLPHGSEENPDVPARSVPGGTELSGGIPFLSDGPDRARRALRLAPPMRSSKERTPASSACIADSALARPALALATSSRRSTRGRPRGSRRLACRPAGAAALARGLLALVFVEDQLAQADRLRGHLDALVVAHELQRVLQREPGRGGRGGPAGRRWRRGCWSGAFP